jgi:cell division transport system ATP-binding protein
MVRFENVGMRYGAGPEVLRDVSFSLEPGSFTFLTGLSGAGKTTLLKLIYVAEPPSRGLITLFGEDLSTARRKALPGLRRRIGVVFQDFRLLNHLSAFDNVALPLRLAGKRMGDYTHDVRELLSWVGLGDRMNATPPTLSGGEQQRVAIARAVANAPRVLFADEPTGNLDPHTADHVFQALMQLVKATQVSMLIATHNMELAGRMDRRVSLSNGQVVELE